MQLYVTERPVCVCVRVFVGVCVCVGPPVADRPCRHGSVFAALSGSEFGIFEGALSAHGHHQ